MREAMRACRAKGVENVVMTMWGDNGAECSKFAVLPALYSVAQMARGIDDEGAIYANFAKEYGYLFRSLRALCNFLNIKADLGIRTRAAYLAG